MNKTGPRTLEELDVDWLPGASAFVGLSLGAMVIRWGPYDPKEVGPIMERLAAGDPDRKIPFFVGLQCDPLPDVAETILGMGWMPREQYEREIAELCDCPDGEHVDDCPNHPDQNSGDENVE